MKFKQGDIVSYEGTLKYMPLPYTKIIKLDKRMSREGNEVYRIKHPQGPRGWVGVGEKALTLLSELDILALKINLKIQYKQKKKK